MSTSERKSVLVHLRIPFSFFLLPIFLFGWAQSVPVEYNAWPLLIILHLLVYPSSNGYNSFMDQDTESIGGIERPEPVPRSMFLVSILLDAVALMATWLFYIPEVSAMLLAYILASRAYSYRGIRLKKYPVIGFLTVFFFQGAMVFWITKTALAGTVLWNQEVLVGALISAFMIGASYPLTQVYQHKQDRADGVQSISMLLGVRGTFVFSATMFLVFNALALMYALRFLDDWKYFVGLLVITGPTAMYFIQWATRVWRDPSQANYRSSMRMSKTGSLCLNLLFLVLLILKSISTH